ncbi:MAG: SPOR domain-containing protein [Pseudomonadota bacterium]
MAIAEPQKRRGFLGGLFAPRAASEPLNAVGAEAAPTEAGVALDATEVEAGTATLPEPAPAPVAEATDVEVADTASAAAPDAASAAETQSKPRRGFLGGLFAPRASQEPLSAVGATSAVATSGTILEGGEVITATALPAPATAPAPSRQSAALDTPYLQVATFRSESDAKEASVRLRERGIVPMIFEQPAGSDSGWRVVVGPASNSSEQSMLLRQVKRLGYDDAYAVSR